MPRLVLVHDNIVGPTGMGRVAEWVARTVLDSGWQLTLVANAVAPDVAAQAEVLQARSRPLPALPQHQLWVRRARAALRGAQGDVVHVHSPALIDTADVMTCHHLAAAAAGYGVREQGSFPVGTLRRIQARATIALDERAYRRRAADTRMTFVSEFLRDEFARRYGEPKDGTILAPPAPPWRPVSSDHRRVARARLGLAVDGRPVVGYLGGDDPRKGVTAMIELAQDSRFHVLLAGKRSEQIDAPGASRLGYVDPDVVIEASDVVAAPALFDAAPVAVLQPLARGVPVVVRPANGWAPAVAREGAGEVWNGSTPLAAAIDGASRCSPDSCRAVIESVSPERQRGRLLAVYERVLEERGR
jgi:glycosyltransferase involved in cell wall biosynthesis